MNIFMKNNSLELIYEISKEKLNIQQTQKNSLENKASTLIAFTGGILALLMGAYDTITKYPIISQTLIIISVIGFALTVIQSIAVIWVKKYRTDPNIEKLAENYLEKSQDEVTLQLISNCIGAWKHNEKIIERNADLLKFAFLYESIALILLGTSFGISVLSK